MNKAASFLFLALACQLCLLMCSNLAHAASASSSIYQVVAQTALVETSITFKQIRQNGPAAFHNGKLKLFGASDTTFTVEGTQINVFTYKVPQGKPVVSQASFKTNSKGTSDVFLAINRKNKFQIHQNRAVVDVIY